MPDSNMVMLMFLPDKEGVVVPEKSELLSILKEVDAETIEPYKEEVSDEPLVSNLPKKGKIKKEKEDIFGTTKLTLSNGVNVWVKKTDFTPNEIIMDAFSWGGNSLYSDDDYINTSNIGLVSLGGMGNFSAVDLQKKLAGKMVSADTNVSDNNESVSANCVKKDLETMMQCVYLAFTAPRKDQEAYEALTQRVKASLANQELNPRTSLTDTIIKEAYKNHKRSLRFKAEDIDKLDYDHVIQLYKERFADANDFDFFFVGDIDIDSLKPMLEKYIATLPVLKSKENYKLTTNTLADGKIKNVFEKEQETPSAIVNFIYHCDMPYTLRNRITMSFLSQILDMVYTQTVREDEGGAYSVGVSGSVSRYPKEEAEFTVSLPTAPEKREMMTEVVYKGIADMVANGPQQEHIDKVREYMSRTFTENQKKNSYWLDIIRSMVKQGIDNNTDYMNIVNSITASDIQNMAKSVFESGNVIEVGMTSPVK
jgi:zinc protease